MSTAEHLKERAQLVKEKLQEQAPNQRQLIGAVTIMTIIVLLTTVGGLLIGGFALGAAILTPILIFFSPVLVPLATILFLGVAGLLSAGGTALAAYSSLRWLYEYFQGHHPVGSDKVDAAKNRLVDTASHLKERASVYVHGVQENIHQAKEQIVDPVAIAK